MAAAVEQILKFIPDVEDADVLKAFAGIEKYLKTLEGIDLIDTSAVEDQVDDVLKEIDKIFTQADDIQSAFDNLDMDQLTAAIDNLTDEDLDKISKGLQDSMENFDTKKLEKASIKEWW